MQLPNSPKGRAGPGLQQIVHQIECFYISFRTAVGYLVLYIFSLKIIIHSFIHSFKGFLVLFGCSLYLG